MIGEHGDDSGEVEMTTDKTLQIDLNIWLYGGERDLNNFNLKSPIQKYKQLLFLGGGGGSCMYAYILYLAGRLPSK